MLFFTVCRSYISHCVSKCVMSFCLLNDYWLIEHSFVVVSFRSSEAATSNCELLLIYTASVNCDLLPWLTNVTKIWSKWTSMSNQSTRFYLSWDTCTDDTWKVISFKSCGQDIQPDKQTDRQTEWQCGSTEVFGKHNNNNHLTAVCPGQPG